GEAALTDFSLTVEPGEKILVLGHTGSGKSTLIALLARFYDADQGMVTLGGKPVQDYSESVLRSQLSVLSQPVQLFSGSVRDNLRLAGEALDDNAMLAALNAVRLDQELGEAPLDYAIGESGSRLSGGQRKRLALARAMLRAAPVLLLDEPTEGLDQATEAQVVKNLLRQSAGQTVLMISHHLQTAPLFDRVLILDRGRLVEQGAPDQLAQQAGSRYQELMAV
ncbi:MAG: ATP-binding cassette domain-containing protein, partial [Gammaproteobacteria bacterium]|nr:ATP-binding cassette domain-containing protein [Gammaproteobacteria bacterium]